MQKLRDLLTGDDERRAALRSLGGLLIGLGILLIAIRQDDDWGDVAMLATFLVPCVFLYGFGLAGRRAEDGARAWHSVFLVFGLLFVPLVLFQFLEVVDGNPNASLNIAWIFLVVAAAGAVAGLKGAPFGFLVCGLALILAWLGVWDEILSDGVGANFDTLRILFIVIALILVAGAFAVRRREPDAGRAWGSELVSAAGVAAIVGLGVISFTGVGELFVDAGQYAQIGTEGLETPPETPFDPETAFAAEGADVELSGPNVGWDLALLAVSIGLILFGTAHAGARGPAYVGVAGLLVFLALVGSDLDGLIDAGGEELADFDPDLVGWPLIVLGAGLVAFAISLIVGGRPRPAPATQVAAPAQQQPAPTEQQQAPTQQQPTEPAPPPSAGPAADWYPDPTSQKRLRYWDGSAWTDYTAD